MFELWTRLVMSKLKLTNLFVVRCRFATVLPLSMTLSWPGLAEPVGLKARNRSKIGFADTWLIVIVAETAAALPLTSVAFTLTVKFPGDV